MFCAYAHAVDRHLTRRRFLELSAALALVGTACGSDESDLADSAALVTPRQAATEPLALSPPSNPAPLIIFITIDDLNDYVGFLDGYTGAVTPNLDALAAESVSYERAYCSSPACGSSRASFLFGEDPTVSGLYSNEQWQWWRSPAISQRESLPLRLNKAGYTTLGFGKVFHTPNREHGGAEAGAWSHFEHTGNPPLATSQLSKTEFGGWGSFGPQGTDDDQPDFVHMRRSLELLADGIDGPTALFLGLFKPHLPFVVPKRYFDLYDAEAIRLPDYASTFEDGARPDWDLEDLPWGATRMVRHARQAIFDRVLANDEWQALVHAYLASVSFSDYLVGELLDGLAALGLLDQATIIVTSDHGYQLGEKTTVTKFTLWEQGTRVPLLVRLPQGGTGRVGSPVSLLDLAPTIDRLGGITTANDQPGTDLIATAMSPNTDRIVNSAYHFEDNNGTVLAITARDRRYRLTRYNWRNFEMYDYDNDPMELTNLVHETNEPLSAEHQAAYDRLNGTIPWEPASPLV